MKKVSSAIPFRCSPRGSFSNNFPSELKTNKLLAKSSGFVKAEITISEPYSIYSTVITGQILDLLFKNDRTVAK